MREAHRAICLLHDCQPNAALAAAAELLASSTDSVYQLGIDALHTECIWRHRVAEMSLELRAFVIDMLRSQVKPQDRGRGVLIRGCLGDHRVMRELEDLSSFWTVTCCGMLGTNDALSWLERLVDSDSSADYARRSAAIQLAKHGQESGVVFLRESRRSASKPRLSRSECALAAAGDPQARRILVDALRGLDEEDRDRLALQVNFCTTFPDLRWTDWPARLIAKLENEA